MFLKKMDILEVNDVLKTATEYKSKLNLLCDELENAQQQILTSSGDAETLVCTHFEALIETLRQTLTERCLELINETKCIKDKYLRPLKECQGVIEGRIRDTQNLINLGESIVKSTDNTSTPISLEEFNKKSILLGTLPEVPPLKDVPFVTFQYDKNVDTELVDICKNLGHISHRGPVQICNIVENSGGLLIQWQNVCDIVMEEKYGDIKEYQLQMALGDATRQKLKVFDFYTCYNGTDMQYLVKDLKLNEPYSFRICCKFDGCSDWSPWSVPQAGLTKLAPYAWKDNKDYSLSNDNKIAKAVIHQPTFLISNGAQVKQGFSVEFIFLETDENCDDAFIGLVKDCGLRNGNVFDNSLLIKASGEIFIDSSQKSTKLPKIVDGSKVCFAYEALCDDRIRINIDSRDKRVTYDWITSSEDLNFIAMFTTSKWKIMVE